MEVDTNATPTQASVRAEAQAVDKDAVQVPDTPTPVSRSGLITLQLTLTASRIY